MFNLIAGAFMSIASLFSGLFGGHPGQGHDGMGSTTPRDGMHMGSTTDDHMMGPDVVGIVQSVNGTSLTVLGMQGMHGATTTFTVDASNAHVIKQKVGTTTLSSVAQGDHVVVNGQVSGTSVTAKLILDGVLVPTVSNGHMMPMGEGMDQGENGDMHMGSSTHPHPSTGWNPGGPMKPVNSSENSH